MFRPEDSGINFVVPDAKTLQAFQPYGISYGKVNPGIFTDVKEEISGINCFRS